MAVKWWWLLLLMLRENMTKAKVVADKNTMDPNPVYHSHTQQMFFLIHAQINETHESLFS